MKKFVFLSSCFVFLAHSMETEQNYTKKTLQEKIVVLVEQQQQSKKQVTSDFQIYQLLLLVQNDTPFFLPYDLIKFILLEVESDPLQTIFDHYECRDAQSHYLDNPYGYLVKYLQKKNCIELEELFDSLPARESTLKMALRMVYGKRDTSLRSTVIIPHALSGVYKRNCNLDHTPFHRFFNGSGGVRRGPSVEIYDKNLFNGKLKNHLKDFLALLQPVLLDQIRILFIEGNELSTLPETFGLLKELRVLSLNKNNFKEVPALIKQCKHLECLDLNDNQIGELPQWLVEYTGQRLDISIDKGVRVPWSKEEYSKIKIS